MVSYEEMMTLGSFWHSETLEKRKQSRKFLTFFYTSTGIWTSVWINSKIYQTLKIFGLYFCPAKPQMLYQYLASYKLLGKNPLEMPLLEPKYVGWIKRLMNYEDLGESVIQLTMEHKKRFRLFHTSTLILPILNAHLERFVYQCEKKHVDFLYPWKN